MEQKQKTLGFLEQSVDKITHLIADLGANTFRKEGFGELSMRQVLYMEAIARLEHPSFSELAEELGITRSSVTILVGKLARNGYVQKVQDGNDHRSFHIVLTEKGKQFTLIHRGIHQQMVQLLTSRLNDDEIEQLTVLLKKAVN
jgi:DNA-binding MarR family transcriptional regulator